MISFQHFNEKCDIVQWGAMNTAWEFNCLANIHSVQQSGDTGGLFTHPGHIWLWNSCQHNETVKNYLCLQNRQTCTVIDTGGKEIPPPLVLLTSFKASDTTVQMRQSRV